jgi:hypothetical protein
MKNVSLFMCRERLIGSLGPLYLVVFYLYLLEILSSSQSITGLTTDFASRKYLPGIVTLLKKIS